MVGQEVSTENRRYPVGQMMRYFAVSVAILLLSSAGWFIPVVLGAVVPLVSRGLGFKAPDVDQGATTKTLALLMSLFCAYAVNFVRWQRFQAEYQLRDLRRLLSDEIARAASHSAVNSAVASLASFLRSDPGSVRTHLDNLNQYLSLASGARSPLAQRAVGVLARRHIGALHVDVAQFLENGVVLDQRTRAELYSSLTQDAHSFWTIERVPMAPDSGWSSGFVSFLRTLHRSANNPAIRYTLLSTDETRMQGRSATGTLAGGTYPGLVTLRSLKQFLSTIDGELFFCDQNKLSAETVNAVGESEFIVVIDDKVAIIGPTPDSFQSAEHSIRLVELKSCSKVSALVSSIRDHSCRFDKRLLAAVSDRAA